MARTLQVEVVTPSAVVFKDEVEMVVATTTEGEVGILPLHAPIVAELAPGELRLRKGAGPETTIFFATFGGYLQFADDRMIILADNAINVADVDVPQVESSLERLTARLAQAKDSDEGDADALAREIEWLENCCVVANRRSQN